MGNIRKKYPASFKTRIVVELLKENESQTSICFRYDIHPAQAKK